MTDMQRGQERQQRCSACFETENAMLHTDGAGASRVLCPKCAARDAMQEAVERHLHALVWPVLTQWAKHWHAAGARPGQLQGALWLYGKYWHPDGQLGREDMESPWGDAHGEAIAEILGLTPDERHAPVTAAD